MPSAPAVMLSVSRPHGSWREPPDPDLGAVARSDIAAFHIHSLVIALLPSRNGRDRARLVQVAIELNAARGPAIVLDLGFGVVDQRPQGRLDVLDVAAPQREDVA